MFNTWYFLYFLPKSFLQSAKCIQSYLLLDRRWRWTIISTLLLDAFVPCFWIKRQWENPVLNEDLVGWQRQKQRGYCCFSTFWSYRLTQSTKYLAECTCASWSNSMPHSTRDVGWFGWFDAPTITLWARFACSNSCHKKTVSCKTVIMPWISVILVSLPKIQKVKANILCFSKVSREQQKSL